MPLPVMPIAAETPQQANPYPYAAQQMNQAIQGGMTNAYLPSMLAAQLMQSRLQNQISQPQAQYAPEITQAQLAQTQAMAPYLQAQAQGIYQGDIPLKQAQGGYFGAQGNLINQTTPYQVQQAQGNVYKDPFLQRLFEINKANNTGAIDPSYLSMAGLNIPNKPDNQQPVTIPGMIPGQQPAPGAMNPGQQNAPRQIMPINGQVAPNPLTAPKAFSGDSLQNLLMFGSPYNPIQYDQMKAQATSTATQGVSNWNDILSKANEDADVSNQLQNYLTKFKDSYNKSTYKGATKGNIPSKGLETVLVPGDLSPEQDADYQSRNAAALVAKATFGGSLTNYETQAGASMKPTRTDNPQVANDNADFAIQRAKLMQEFPQFLNSARQQGLDVNTARSVWNMYRQQRPIYDFDNHQPNTQFDGSWREFLNPQAIQAAQTGQPYVSIPQFESQKQAHSWLKSLQPQDRRYAQQMISQGGQ